MPVRGERRAEREAVLGLLVFLAVFEPQKQEVVRLSSCYRGPIHIRTSLDQFLLRYQIIFRCSGSDRMTHTQVSVSLFASCLSNFF